MIFNGWTLFSQSHDNYHGLLYGISHCFPDNDKMLLNTENRYVTFWTTKKFMIAGGLITS